MANSYVVLTFSISRLEQIKKKVKKTDKSNKIIKTNEKVAIFESWKPLETHLEMTTPTEEYRGHNEEKKKHETFERADEEESPRFADIPDYG